MRFKELFKEYSEELAIDEMENEIKGIILKHFPKSYVNTKYSTNLGKSIDINFTLGKNKSEWKNGIELNDPLRHVIIILFKNSGNYDIEIVNGSMTVIPDNKYMAYGRVKTGFRNKSNIGFGEVKSILDKSFKNLKKIIKDNEDKIHPQHIELFKSKNLI
jgi:hypothetical protein